MHLTLMQGGWLATNGRPGTRRVVVVVRNVLLSDLPAVDHPNENLG